MSDRFITQSEMGGHQRAIRVGLVNSIQHWPWHQVESIVHLRGSWQRRNSGPLYLMGILLNVFHSQSLSKCQAFPSTSQTEHCYYECCCVTTCQCSLSTYYVASIVLSIFMWNLFNSHSYWVLLILSSYEAQRSYIYQLHEKASIPWSQTESKSELSITALSQSWWRNVEWGSSKAQEPIHLRRTQELRERIHLKEWVPFPDYSLDGAAPHIVHFSRENSGQELYRA